MSAIAGSPQRRLAPVTALTYAVLTLLLVPRNVVILVLKGYQKVISPLYGDVCRYHPSCSHFAVGTFQLRGVVIGSALTVWRILRCNPWASGGFDYPRSPRHFRYNITHFGLVIPRTGL